MPKLNNGQDNNQAVNPRSAKAFCEGLQFRSEGNGVSRPADANPHEVGSEDNLAWDRGWDVAQAAGTGSGFIDPADAPCCAIITTVIAA